MSGKGKEYQLAIKIAGEIEKSFYESTKLTKKELEDMAKQAAKASMEASAASGSIAKEFQRQLLNAGPAFEGLERMAKKSFQVVAAAAAASGAAVTLGLGASISAGSQFESAFAGVKKTVDATDAELLQLSDDIRQMAKEMPISAAELSGIAESAGQLGIQTENIAAFSKTMANMEVATNLTSGEAAEEFARFANIVGMSQGDFDRLGSSVVALGNNMATTEAEIVEMGMRIAAAGDQVNLSPADIMSYAAALSSVGIEAEAGGSSFSKFLANMQMAAETGKNLEQYAKVAGMTGQEFKKAFEQDAVKAIHAFLAGLNDTEKNGKSAIAVLNDMGITEVRLRDTLLRAAGASELFEESLQISSEAWEENTALANEAAQRYATVESQWDILGNKVTDLGISIYQDLKPGLVSAMELGNEWIDSLAGQEDAIGAFIDSAVQKMPTMVREVRQAGKAFREFADPFLSVGGWLLENPGVIAGAIAGIGTSLATYKVVSGVMSLASALGALGPAGTVIMGLGGAAAVITGIGVSVKKSAEEAKKANLAKHFGNISLSMKELKETASFLVNSKSLEKVRESVAALSELEGITDEISAATEELNRMNWKIAIGMELKEEEKQAYQSNIEEFIRSTQSYVEQDQYAITLAVKTLLGEGMEDSNIVTQLNAFYADKQQELSELGTELNQVITDAFQDGLLDVDEVEQITKLQEQMARVKAALAGNDFEAGMDLVKMKYGGQMLDADSFQNLQAEIGALVKEAMASYDDAFMDSMSRLRTLREEGYITQQEYEAETANLQRGYLEEKTQLQTESADFQLNIIKDLYAEDLAPVLEKLPEELVNVLEHTYVDTTATGNEVAYWNMEAMFGHLEKLGWGKDDVNAFGALWEYMLPQFEELKRTAGQYSEEGMEIPEYLANVISDAETMGVLANGEDAVYSVFEKKVKNSTELQDLFKGMQEQGVFLPEPILNAINENQEVIREALEESNAEIVEASHREMQDEIDAVYGKAFSIPLYFEYKEKAKAPYRMPFIGMADLPGHAEGGIFTQPHLAFFAEKGPEAAIPLDGSRNAVSLWEQTGELLGIPGITGGNDAAGLEQAVYENTGDGIVIHYNPALEIYGNTVSKEEIEDIMEDKQEEFARMFEQYWKNNRRVGFS